MPTTKMWPCASIACTLCFVCLAGSSPFGVSLLGGVRDSRGQFQTFVNSVDERHHRGEGSGIREGMCMHKVHAPLHAVITAS